LRLDQQQTLDNSKNKKPAHTPGEIEKASADLKQYPKPAHVSPPIPVGTIARYVCIALPLNNPSNLTGSRAISIGNSCGKGQLRAICRVELRTGIQCFRLVIDRPGGWEFHDLDPAAVMHAELIDEDASCG